MTAQARQAWLLGALVATLTGVVIYQFVPGGPTGGAAAPSNLQERQAANARAMTVADVNLERLQAGADPYTEPRRDPFRYRPKPAPPPPPPPPVAPPVFLPPQAGTAPDPYCLSCSRISLSFLTSWSP